MITYKLSLVFLLVAFFLTVICSFLICYCLFVFFYTKKSVSVKPSAFSKETTPIFFNGTTNFHFNKNSSTLLVGSIEPLKDLTYSSFCIFPPALNLLKPPINCPPAGNLLESPIKINSIGELVGDPVTPFCVEIKGEIKRISCAGNG